MTHMGVIISRITISTSKTYASITFAIYSVISITCKMTATPTAVLKVNYPLTLLTGPSAPWS